MGAGWHKIRQRYVPCSMASQEGKLLRKGNFSGAGRCILGNGNVCACLTNSCVPEGWNGVQPLGRYPPCLQDLMREGNFTCSPMKHTGPKWEEPEAVSDQAFLPVSLDSGMVKWALGRAGHWSFLCVKHVIAQASWLKIVISLVLPQGDSDLWGPGESIRTEWPSMEDTEVAQARDLRLLTLSRSFFHLVFSLSLSFIFSFPCFTSFFYPVST